MGWFGIGNPQPGHLRDSNAPGIAVGKARAAKVNKQSKPAKTAKVSGSGNKAPKHK